MRVAIEALLVIGGALVLFRFLYSGFLKMRRREREAVREEQRREDEYLDAHIHKEV